MFDHKSTVGSYRLMFTLTKDYHTTRNVQGKFGLLLLEISYHGVVKFQLNLFKAVVTKPYTLCANALSYCQCVKILT